MTTLIDERDGKSLQERLDAIVAKYEHTFMKNTVNNIAEHPITVIESLVALIEDLDGMLEESYENY